MTHQSSSPYRIKGLDWIISRQPNKVNYSALNGTKIVSGKHQKMKYNENREYLEIWQNLWNKNRSSSAPLLKGIDGIVSKYSNKVNYSALNKAKIESRKQLENEIWQKYGISGNMAKYVKQEENAGKNGNLTNPNQTKPNQATNVAI